MSDLIIPNCPPLFVHFTLALFSTAFLFYLLAYITKRFKLFSNTLTQEFEIVGRWCLWCVTVDNGMLGFFCISSSDRQ